MDMSPESMRQHRWMCPAFLVTASQKAESADGVVQSKHKCIRGAIERHERKIGRYRRK